MGTGAESKSKRVEWRRSPLRRKVNRALKPYVPGLLIRFRRVVRNLILSRRAILRIIEDEYGHRRSVKEQSVVDKEGRPLPWYTYPAIEYLSSLDLSDCAVFEWGTGFSTLYWSARAKLVHGVDHDAAWLEKVRHRLRGLSTSTLNLVHANGDEYVNALAAAGMRFDIIVIDGLYRLRCARVAAGHLRPGGFVIFDNSDWFPEACGNLRRAGLLQVDFHGLQPLSYNAGTTSILFHRTFQPRGRHEYLPGRPIAGIRNSYDNDPVLGGGDARSGHREQDVERKT